MTRRYIAKPALAAVAVLALPLALLSSPARAVTDAEPTYTIGSGYALPGSKFDSKLWIGLNLQDLQWRLNTQQRVAPTLRFIPRPNIQQNHQPKYNSSPRYHHNY